ncbi:cation transporter [Candidatus Kaiserbacteria bacterium]|nr:cation transporter [Candidatus Kaiserbacteria bacterium]
MPHTAHAGQCSGHKTGAAHQRKIRLYRYALAIAFLFALIEAVAGYEGDSSSLMADALYLLADNASLMIAIFVANAQMRQRATPALRKTGKRLVVGMLGIFAIFVLIDASRRLVTPHLAYGAVVMWVAVVGIVANLAQHHLLSQVPQSHHDAIHAANAAHILGDLLISIVVVVGGYATMKTGTPWIDPVLSLLIGCWIGWSTIRLWFAEDTEEHGHHHCH